MGMKMNSSLLHVAVVMCAAFLVNTANAFEPGNCPSNPGFGSHGTTPEVEYAVVMQTAGPQVWCGSCVQTLTRSGFDNDVVARYKNNLRKKIESNYEKLEQQ